jgi:soluble P-type ATPase
MAITITVPGRADLVLHRLLMDVNGTLTGRGRLLDGVQGRVESLRRALDVRLLSADTFGTLDDVASALGGVEVARVSSGADKAALALELGADTCVAVGNGANDERLLASVALGIGVLGPEGAAPQTLAAADVVTASILDALGLLLDPKVLAATLRP